jgi:Cupin domain
VIYLLDGTLRVRLADQVEEAPTGAFVFIPRGTPHTWEALGDKAVRFLAVIAPAGLESFFDSTAAAGGGQAGDAFGRFGGDDLRVLGPPLAVSHPL